MRSVPVILNFVVVSRTKYLAMDIGENKIVFYVNK